MGLPPFAIGVRVNPPVAAASLGARLHRMSCDGPIAVMDAECALCTWGARMIHRLDRSGDIRICPIQSERGRVLALSAGVDPDDPETWLFFDETGVWRNAEAIMRVGARCGGIGRVLGVGRLLPRRMRDWLYLKIARNRIRLFGRSDMCAVPDADFRARLLT